MADLEKANRAQLNSALTPTAGRLQRRLPKEELKALGAVLEKMARRYPNQDMTDALPEYMRDYENLALKFSLQSVTEVIEELRVAPDNKFFPSPNDVADRLNEKAEQSRVPGIRETRQYLNEWEQHVAKCKDEAAKAAQ